MNKAREYIEDIKAIKEYACLFSEYNDSQLSLTTDEVIKNTTNRALEQVRKKLFRYINSEEGRLSIKIKCGHHNKVETNIDKIITNIKL